MDIQSRGVMHVTAVAKISQKGQVVIPAEIRRVLNVHEGDRLVFQVNPDGRVEITGLPSMRPESVIGILPYSGEMPDLQELKRKARQRRAEKVLQAGREDE
ncbi:AbrB/MazE/SpoVT family DNA-binding domain-containing protein [Alicyclobacillus macrosporangiidus]|uniref:Looped-hinge helix DNA binding domain-containing protein, AbrB family n=1 Tax=Alicyclobacillus macrosporangiidus TaxID=392015 RepID=A0A1I7GJP7_9BACL|nr:AbrB/MazE/SpoVT family DNA-binding domain-containing protein [Alicyclobacillus macrosporangiidus]SFU48673.1 looped-hinge helix DNA binding domain-containing protein, AbrB family [Alicyclobacillus macrosporangiidus]